MADTKITALAPIGAIDPANDVLPIVDVSNNSMAASGTTCRVTTNQLLQANAIASLASATISGDLTVDTSTLKVDSANDRVGIGTATPAYPLQVAGRISYSTGIGEGADLTVSSSGTSLQFGLGSAWAQQLWYLAGAEAMRLNSTGLGVGGSPAFRLDVQGNVAGAVYGSIANNNTGGSGSARFRVFNSGDVSDGFAIINNYGAAGQINLLNYKASSLALWTNSVERLTIDSSGNVGIGVTPSAWNSAFGSVLQFKSAGSSAGGSLTGSSADNFRMFSNTYYDGAYKYIAAGFATQYEQSAGSHVWYLSGTTAGAINGAITFSTALSLDKTGSLVLGSAAVATTATDGFLYIPGCAGTPTGTPTAKTGRVPLVVDTTNNKLYFYSGGAWVAAN